MPSPGGQINRMATVPLGDLPEGYRPATRGRSVRRSAGGGVEGRPRASGRSGCARSTGWHSERGGGSQDRSGSVCGPSGPFWGREKLPNNEKRR
jgi:hypothetical protein